MSRHVPRRDRWQRHGPIEHRSTDGLVVRFEKGAWWADVAYQLRPDHDGRPDEPVHWESRLERLGPFRRPRNGMVEAERHATMLRNRHGDQVRFPGDDRPT